MSGMVMSACGLKTSLAEDSLTSTCICALARTALLEAFILERPACSEDPLPEHREADRDLGCDDRDAAARLSEVHRRVAPWLRNPGCSEKRKYSWPP